MLDLRFRFKRHPLCEGDIRLLDHCPVTKIFKVVTDQAIRRLIKEAKSFNRTSFAHPEKDDKRMLSLALQLNREEVAAVSKY